MSQKLLQIYDGLEVFSGEKNYTVLPNCSFRLFKRMSDARIVSLDRLMVASEILTYKPTERFPYPSHALLAEVFNVDERAIINSVKALCKAGLFVKMKGLYGLDKRKNVYDVRPLLNVIASYQESVNRGEFVVDVKAFCEDVLSGKIQPKRIELDQVSEASEASEAPSEAPQEERKVVVPEFDAPAEIQAVLDNVDDEYKVKIINALKTKHGQHLSTEATVSVLNRIIDRKASHEVSKAYITTALSKASNESENATQGNLKRSSGMNKLPKEIQKSVDSQKDVSIQFRDLKTKLGDDVLYLFQQETGITLGHEYSYSNNYDTIVSWFDKKVSEMGSVEAVQEQANKLLDDEVTELSASL